ncbi:MAG: hypothetical protein KDC86_19990 [Saprospiraceae bacterium]|nr:hypothetical protein [Saprospiraceae bacterium]
MEKQIRFKTAAGWLGYHSGMPDHNDPGMTEEEHAEWQASVFLDALTPDDEEETPHLELPNEYYR